MIAMLITEVLGTETKGKPVELIEKKQK